MKKIYILITIIAIACSPKQELSKQGTGVYSKQKLEIMPVDEENITFTVKNLSSESLIIFQPKRMNIEKFEDDKWQRLRILVCPCEAPCNQPVEEIELVSGGTYKFEWDKKEGWCGEKNEFGIKKTEKQSVPEGLYRIRIVFGTDVKSKNVLYKEFKIK